MRIVSILTLTAALALPVTAFATPKQNAPATPAKTKPVKHHAIKAKPGDKPIAAPTTPAPVTPAPANPPMTKTPAK